MLAGSESSEKQDRILARFVDLGMWGLISLAVAANLTRFYTRNFVPDDVPAGAIPSSFTAVFPFFCAIAVAAHEVVTLGLQQGSIGKRLFGLRVRAVDGRPWTIKRSFLRISPILLVGIGFSLSPFTPVVVWWATMATGLFVSCVGLGQIVTGRQTLWDRIAGSEVLRLEDG